MSGHLPRLPRLPRLAIFARAPVRGRVKTRLARVLGDDVALAAYERLLSQTLVGLAPGRGRFQPEIWLEGTAAEARFQGFDVFPQPKGDLGLRMAAAFEAGVTALVGTDIPALTVDYVDRGLAALDEVDLVIGPVEDGGYCLIAMNAPHAELFRGVPWSTPRVLAATLDAARRLNLTVRLLEALWDVDDESDFDRWRSSGPTGKRTETDAQTTHR